MASNFQLKIVKRQFLTFVIQSQMHVARNHSLIRKRQKNLFQGSWTTPAIVLGIDMCLGPNFLMYNRDFRKNRIVWAFGLGTKKIIMWIAVHHINRLRNSLAMACTALHRFAVCCSCHWHVLYSDVSFAETCFTWMWLNQLLIEKILSHTLRHQRQNYSAGTLWSSVVSCLGESLVYVAELYFAQDLHTESVSHSIQWVFTAFMRSQYPSGVLIMQCYTMY